LTAHNVEMCFNFLDADSDGSLSREDLKCSLGNELDDYFIGNMIEDADDNCNGYLRLPEFTLLMLKILRSTEKQN